MTVINIADRRKLTDAERAAWLNAMELALQLDEIEDAIEILKREGYDYPASILGDILEMYE